MTAEALLVRNVSSHQLHLTCIGKEGASQREKKRGEELVKDMREGDKARWNCDALHSIMLMRRIIMSPPQAVEADSGCGRKPV